MQFLHTYNRDRATMINYMIRFLGFGVPLAIIALITTLIAALGYRTRLVSLTPAFITFGLGLLVALTSIAISLAGTIFVVAKGLRPGYGLSQILLGMGIAGLVIAIPGYLLFTGGGQGLPAIHDISTDIEDPPLFVDVLPLRANAPNTADYGGPEIGQLQRQAYPDIIPLILAGAPEQVFDQALTTAMELGWTIAGSNREDGRIEATDTTFWFGFEDDVVVRLRPDKNGTRVDVRSVSRVGGGDVGTNSKRIRGYLAKLKDTLAP